MTDETRRQLREQIEAKLSSKKLLSNLLTASLFLTAYELLRSCIVDDIRSFYCSAYLTDPSAKTSEYVTEVLSLDKSVFRASCEWLVRKGVISQHEVQVILEIRKQRNRIAHELPKLLLEPNTDIDCSLLRNAKHYLRVIGRFWARIDIECNPDFDGVDIKDEDILPGRSAALSLVLSALDLS